MSTQLPTEINRDNWREFAAPAVDPSLWTAVIPAAGRGSRLGSSRAKILFPVANRLLLEWLLDFLEPNCCRLVFVLSPSGEREVQPELERLIPGRYDIVIQEVPKGMGDAVGRAVPVLKTRHAAIVWGDQVALRRRSVEACLRLHAGPLNPALTCPTVFRANPYIHFERDAAGQIRGLRQAREGDTMPEYGESDTGFFCFRTGALRDLLDRIGRDPAQRGNSTGEANFLPVIPMAASEGLVVLTPGLMTLKETIGINSVEDVTIVEDFLRNPDASPDRQSC